MIAQRRRRWQLRAYLLEFLVVFSVDGALVGGAFTTLGFGDKSDERGLGFEVEGVVGGGSVSAKSVRATRTNARMITGSKRQTSSNKTKHLKRRSPHDQVFFPILSRLRPALPFRFQPLFELPLPPNCVRIS